ncbi:membrane protein [Oceaniferula spumae]|uniref:Membrane protein n=1 Tax=Oceaniferula spumae TaxID=2979115 RepID=A0AAT9FMS1_9BACT
MSENLKKSSAEKPKWQRWLTKTGLALLVLLASLVVLYYWGMICYDGPFKSGGFWNGLLAMLWLGLGVYFWRKFKTRKQRVILCGVAVAVILVPRAFVKPSNGREWAPEFARTGYSEREGDVVTLKNVRNFSYTREGEATERWETRTVHLSNLRSMDLFHTTFGGDRIGHPLLSFDFGPDGRICLTVETRREENEEFSVVGGLYKMFELQYIFATEEDCVRLRASVRDEAVYIYRINMPLDEARNLFVGALEVQNDLAKKPRFYNVIYSNCTTSLRDRLPEDQRGKFDIRMLVNGLLDEYLYEHNKFKDGGLPFHELRKRAYINPAAQKFHDSVDFSQRIREGRAGM